jgi:hypothetical protein
MPLVGNEDTLVKKITQSGKHNPDAKGNQE